MTEHERNLLVTAAFDQGIRTAAEMVRHCATSVGFKLALRISPEAALMHLAKAIEDTTTNPPASDP